MVYLYGMYLRTLEGESQDMGASLTATFNPQGFEYLSMCCGERQRYKLALYMCMDSKLWACMRWLVVASNMARAKDQDDVKWKWQGLKDQDDVKWKWQGLKDQDDVKMNMARAKDQDDVKWKWQGLKDQDDVKWKWQGLKDQDDVKWKWQGLKD